MHRELEQLHVTSTRQKDVAEAKRRQARELAERERKAQEVAEEEKERARLARDEVLIMVFHQIQDVIWMRLI